jgi:hypothetical protein
VMETSACDRDRQHGCESRNSVTMVLTSRDVDSGARPSRFGHADGIWNHSVCPRD